MTSKFPVCGSCGVAFDVGAKCCTTKWCDLYDSESVVVEKKQRKRYPYNTKPIDPIVSRWRGIISRSKKREYQFDITVDDVREIVNSPCVYCGSIDRIEVDRKDNTRGYTTDNVAPACHRCNTIKNNVVSYEDMMFIANHLGWRK